MKPHPTPIDALILDFDGVLTNNKVYLSEDGIESVRCDRSDGQGVKDVMAHGIPVLVLSREENPVVKVRCQKLGIECIHGELKKADRLAALCREKGWKPENLVYIGNDLPDIPPMNMVGYAVCVADAYADVFPHADLVLSRNGGDGAVREFCDILLKRS